MDAHRLALRVPPEEIKVETTKKRIEVYICPTPGCQSATITKPGEKLEDEWTGVKVENRVAKAESSGSEYSHCRAECPHCRVSLGKRVMRVRLATVVPVPVIGPEPPPLPPPSGTIHPIGASKPEG